MESLSHVEYQRFQRTESCTEEGCRARKFYIEDGKKFCQRGHEQAGFTQTQQDEDDWNAQGRRSRRKQEEAEQAARIVGGREATDLYLQCYQLILWKQCHWLLNMKGLPRELETVIRDLWSLRIKAFQMAGEEMSGYSFGGFSSTGDGDNTDSDTNDAKSWASRRTLLEVIGKDKLPKLIETLALCYLGTLLMRLPISLGELYRWAANDEITYIRAIKEVPKEMRARLPAHFHSALEIKAPLRAHALQVAVSKMIEFYNAHYEMAFPPLNIPPLLFKHTTCLGLPVEIYGAVMNLATLLSVDFTYSTVQRKQLSHKTYPEIQLVSFIVIAVKLSHPFDEIIRIPEHGSDPTTVKVDWNVWKDVMAGPWDELKAAGHMDTTDTDILTMSGKCIDDYLDWYQRTWIDDRDPKMATQILELFPLPELLPHPDQPVYLEQKLNRLKGVQRSLIIQKSQEPAESLATSGSKRPGTYYKRYRRADELPEIARTFFDMAAACAGTSVNMLIKSVFRAELQLGKWQLSYQKSRPSLDVNTESDHISSSDG